eukprot:CAMPEP_0174727418 /NCGR_PEP_ID=MMETSP1094-20130205/49747_1 /TAXON_ID=156173 /ORGANISM="Chrysochromulina brevifilum, Strain UTEX LB 985" /LENGTH=74 /DNA_ID=CAMNT_0015929157 /DNA_START=765 /DNA_END=986 /DNA_ORIENTATION=+
MRDACSAEPNNSPRASLLRPSVGRRKDAISSSVRAPLSLVPPRDSEHKPPASDPSTSATVGPGWFTGETSPGVK